MANASEHAGLLFERVGEVSYQYDELKTSGTIRLLKLQPGDGEKLECSICHYVLGSAPCPEYTALSYTWGNDEASYRIFLPDDSVIKIRKNLNNALHSVRNGEKRFQECWLWTDAICINQGSSAERNHQVKLMADIYGKATTVLAWLESNGTVHEEKTQHEFAKIAFQFIHDATIYNDSERSVLHYSRDFPDGIITKWKAVRALCGFHYWTRKWIIQELLRGRDIVLMFEDLLCPMASFENFCSQLQQRRNDEELDPVLAAVVDSPAANLALQRAEAIYQHPGLIHELVERYADNQCGLPCDHVYALYSLIGEDHRKNLPIDYDATAVQRFVDVVRFVDTYERQDSLRMVEIIDLLMNKFELGLKDILQERQLVAGLTLTVNARVLGRLSGPPVLRSRSELDAMPERIAMHRFDSTRTFTGKGGRAMRSGRVKSWTTTTPDLTIFTDCFLRAGDEIWQFPNIQAFYAVREETPAGGGEEVGRGGGGIVILCRVGRFRGIEVYDAPGLSHRGITIDLATLVELNWTKPMNEMALYKFSMIIMVGLFVVGIVIAIARRAGDSS